MINIKMLQLFTSGEVAPISFKCQECQKIFKNQYRLSRHKKDEGHQVAGRGRKTKNV